MIYTPDDLEIRKNFFVRNTLVEWDGEKWKKISEYHSDDMVLEYDILTQRFSLKKPMQYIKKECNHFWHFWSDNFDEYISDDHIINYDPVNLKSCISLLREMFGENLPKNPVKLHSIKKPFYSDFKYVYVNGKIEKEPYENIWVEKVEAENPHKYCFSTTSGYFMTRRNGKITITHNCGKSFSMKAMIELLDKVNKSYLLLSPTAKAAKVLEAATNRSASTIHRGLGVNYDLTFLHNERNPILSDVVIVDEFSMVDTDLFYNLLKAIDFQKTKLLLVFDPAQLSSVGPGNLAYDLVQSDLFAGVSLNQIFRYSEGGLITVATDTRNCKPFLPKSARFKITKMGKSFVFIPSDNEWCVEGVVGLYQERLKRGDTTSDLIVISARNTGPQGTIEINKQIQRAINPQPADQIITIPKDGTEIEYRLNDVVMQTANDYHSIVCDPDGSYLVNDDGDPENEVLVANGESGIITKVEKDFVVIKYDDYFIRRDKEDLQRTQLGYAISCHRSQGSGYKNVIIVAPSAHTWQLNSNLLYVGFTRAQEHCWCIGSIDTVNKAVTKKMESTRKTNVSWLLAKLYDKLEEEDEE